MAATMNGQAVQQSAGPVTSISVTLGSAPVVGEKLLAFVHHSDDYPAGPAGWMKDMEEAGNSVVQVWSRTVDGSEGSTFTFTAPSPGGMAVRVMRWSGLGAVDNTSSGGSNVTGAINLGPTTAGLNTINFAVVGLRASTLPLTDAAWTNGFVQVGPDVKSTGSGFKAHLAVASFRNTVDEAALSTQASYTIQSATVPEGKIIGYDEVAAPEPTDPTAELVRFVGGQWTTQPAKLMRWSPANGWVDA
jgi:hypothetical protein